MERPAAPARTAADGVAHEPQGLSPDVLAALPAGTIDSLDPQALTSPDAQETLRAQLGSGANANGLYDALIAGMRDALSIALHDVFLMATFVAIVAFCFALFLKEIPLRKRQQIVVAAAEPAEGGVPDGQPQLATNANLSSGFHD